MRKFLKCYKCKVTKPFKYLSNAKQWMKNLFKCCKNTKKEELKRWHSDIKGDDIEKISEDKINFVYENGIDYLKEIDVGMRLINTRTTLLLTYLALSISFIVNFALTTKNELLEILSLVIAIEYISLIFYTTIYLFVKNQRGFSVKNEPRNLLIDKAIKLDLKTIKFYECESMQNRVNFNSLRQRKLFNHLKYAILLTFGLPSVTAFLFLLWRIFFPAFNY